MGYSISAYYSIPYKLPHLLHGDGRQRLGLNQFGEIVNNYHQIFELPRGKGEWPEYI